MLSPVSENVEFQSRWTRDSLRAAAENGLMPARQMKDKIEFEILACSSAKIWQRWLAKNHTKTPGVWLQFFKKDSGIPTVAYSEALDAALCYGWIDGQVRKHDTKSWLQKFTPRRPKSLWSKRNCDHIERLTAGGRMRAAGLKQVTAARADGRWNRAYDSPAKMTVPADFLLAIARNKKTKKFFDSLNKTNRYTIAWRLQTAPTPAIRERRLKLILDRLRQGRKFHE
jgi:uncharacterized protein YdeI (YjbR/CyaY-like superfamily)